MLLLAALFVSSRLKPHSRALWEAVLSSNYNEAMLMIRAGADVNTVRPYDEEAESLLHLLAKQTSNKNCIKLALLMLDYGANANLIDAMGNSVLHYAVRNSSLELVEKLLERGAKVDVSNKHNVDVLFDAAMNLKRRELLLLLLKYDVPDLETRNRRGVTALKYVIHRSFTKYDEDTIRALLDLGLPVNQPETYSGWTALHYAIVMDNITLVNLLLQYGADVNEKSRAGVMPLGYASGRRTSCIAKILIEKGANVHESSDDGQYPIHFACSHRSVDNIRLLLQKGSDMNATDENGATPFSWMKRVLIESSQIVIKHFAVLSTKGIFVNNSDLELIHENPEAQEFYEQCLDEVQKMKKTRILDCFSFFDIVDRTFQELAFLARNEKFVESFNESEGEKLFPIFFVELDAALKNAVECRNRLMLNEKALCESLFKILPELVLDKIIFYMYLNELY